MPSTPYERCTHILDAIANIHSLLDGLGSNVLEDLVTIRPAFERHLEVISEAVRHLPETARAEFPSIPWNDIAALGNRLRHGYDAVRADVLWAVYTLELDALEFAVIQMRDGFGSPE